MQRTDHSDPVTYRRRCLGVPGAAVALSIAACSNAGPQFNGTANLKWTAVTTNTHGGPLWDLAGYKVFYGTSASSMNTVVVLSNPNVRTFVVTNLSPGTWYFAVAAYTASGTQGLHSNVATKKLD